ncbi:hypothetical protein BAY1663_02522 [Pseudomonas sp. BAY1663]|nr:hypothetical protein BAY1663_02522 [Pseudomonas sp. BAY1663]
MSESPLSAHVILDQLLAVLDIGVTHFTVCDIRNGWGMRFDSCKTASLHYCLEGAGTLAFMADRLFNSSHTVSYFCHLGLLTTLKAPR